MKGKRVGKKRDAILIQDIRQMIAEARRKVVVAANSGLTVLYWRIGQRINTEVRAAYGKKIIGKVSKKLTAEYGQGFNYSALTRMSRFAATFKDVKKVATLSQLLSWSHFLELLPLDKPMQRDFYIVMCQTEQWSVRTLRQKINSMLYDRTAISRKSTGVIRRELESLQSHGQMTPDIAFKDPYILDFLGLKDSCFEVDIEKAILRKMESFILELGVDFAFLARQKRIIVDNDDYYLDLLFFHRGLKRLVAIDLKLGEFQPAYKGQMELYLQWLQRYETKPGENSPIGLILCAGKKEETVELLKMEKSGIRVAEYLLELPPRHILEEKLHKAVEYARSRLKPDR